MQSISSLKKFQLLAVTAFIMLLGVAALAMAPVQHAFADDAPSYTLNFESDAGSTIEPDQTFTVNVVLARDGLDTYKMYAFSSTIRFSNSMFELVECTASSSPKVDVYTSDLSGSWEGWTDVVLNYKSATLKGTDWESPHTVLTLTLKAKESGSSNIMFRRANISNTTGMGSYACVCTDVVVTVSSPAAEEESSSASSSESTPAVAPSADTSAGTTAGVAAAEADTSELGDDVDYSNLTDEERKELEDMGYDVDALVAEQQAAAAESTASSAASGSVSSGASSTETGSSAGSSNSMTPVIIGVVIVLVIALAVGLFLYFRKKKQSEEAETVAGGSEQPLE